MADLTLVPLQDILAEMDRRFDAYVLMAASTLQVGVEKQEWHTRGSISTRLGLTELLRMVLLGEWEQQRRERRADGDG